MCVCACVGGGCREKYVKGLLQFSIENDTDIETLTFKFKCYRVLYLDA